MSETIDNENLYVSVFQTNVIKIYWNHLQLERLPFVDNCSNDHHLGKNHRNCHERQTANVNRVVQM